MSIPRKVNVSSIQEFPPLTPAAPAMASERASPTYTIATTTLSSDNESSKTMVLIAATMDQIEQKPGVERPIVKLPPRPSTAPPAIQTPTAIPSVETPQALPSESLPNDAALSPAVIAPVEPALNAKGDVNAMKKTGNQIFIDETTALTGLPPVYPVSKRALQELVYPNTHPHFIIQPG